MNDPDPIPANSPSFEYVYVANQHCACGGLLAIVRQELVNRPSGPLDRLVARCQACGAELTFEFDIASFFGQFEKYSRFHQTEDSFRQAMGHVRAGELAEAECALRRVVDAQEGEPAFAWGHYHLGRVLLLEQRAKEAITHLEWAVGIQPLEADIHEVLASAYQSVGRMEEADRHREQSASLRDRLGSED